MKQQIKEWYKEWFGEPTPNLYIVDGVELTFKEIVQKARADVGGKIVVEGKEFSCRFFDEAEKWQKWKDRAFWVIMGGLYCVAFSLIPLMNTVFLAIPLTLLAALLIFTFYAYRKVRKLHKIFGIEELELEILEKQQELERMKEKRDERKT
jgi:hypothetical protein